MDKSRREYVDKIIRRYGSDIVMYFGRRSPMPDGKFSGFDRNKLKVTAWMDDYINSSINGIVIYWEHGFMSYTAISFEEFDQFVRDLRLGELGI